MRLREKSWVDLESPYRNRIRRSYEVFKPTSYVPSDPLTSPKRVRSRREEPGGAGSDRDGLRSGTTHRTHETSVTARTSRSSRLQQPGNGLVREGTFWSGGLRKEGSIMRYEHVSVNMIHATRTRHTTHDDMRSNSHNVVNNSHKKPVLGCS